MRARALLVLLCLLAAACARQSANEGGLGDVHADPLGGGEQQPE
jgi:hypothetical protein